MCDSVHVLRAVLGSVGRRLGQFPSIFELLVAQSECIAARARVRQDGINSLFGDEHLCLMSSYYYSILNAINSGEEKLCFVCYRLFKRHCRHRQCIDSHTGIEGDRERNDWRKPTVFVCAIVFDRLLLKFCFRPLCQNMEIKFVCLLRVVARLGMKRRAQFFFLLFFSFFLSLRAIRAHVERRTIDERWLMGASQRRKKTTHNILSGGKWQ